MDINDWLRKQMISAAAYEADVLLASFLDEMEKGLNGEASSLLMIPAYVGTEGQVPKDTPVAVIDAGGTNLRICIARFDTQGGIQLSSFSKQPMPGRDHELTASQFYAELADALEPLKDEFQQIGFCFSYPATIMPDFDGRLLHWTKEIKVPELVGKHIGEGLLATLEARGVAGKQLVVLNDTVATLLAGLAEGQTFNASSYIGFILGTGTNTAYVERNENIGKLDGYLAEGTQVINVESGGFAAFQRGPFDLQLDARSESPGSHVFEKLISGVYMGSLTLELLQALAEEEVFSDSGGAAFSIMKDLSTINIDNLAADNGRDTGVLGSEAFSDADREIMRTVFVAVVDRAALLTAVNMAAAVVKSGKGQEETKPVCINIDGSTYYKTYQLADKVQAHLKELLGARGLHIRCIQVDDAPVVGAAIAGLTTFQ
jgi:hexokinase